jgi:23S rRNA (cytidine2498-2'-O)-methyltransferase
MIEKPQRVGQLVCDWLINEWCQESIFNLKLPMKKRYETVVEVLDMMQQKLDEAGLDVEFQAKHLYHDREEVTVHVRKF